MDKTHTLATLNSIILLKYIGWSNVWFAKIRFWGNFCKVSSVEHEGNIKLALLGLLD